MSSEELIIDCIYNINNYLKDISYPLSIILNGHEITYPHLKNYTDNIEENLKKISKKNISKDLN